MGIFKRKLIAESFVLKQVHLLVVKLMLTKFVNAHLIKRIDKRLPLIKLMDMFACLPNFSSKYHFEWFFHKYLKNLFDVFLRLCANFVSQISKILMNRIDQRPKLSENVPKIKLMRTIACNKNGQMKKIF